MRHRVRHLIPITMAAAMVLAIVPATTLAQDEEPTFEPAAGINAATVDGKSAVGYTRKQGKRAKKLVATNKHGFLPNNIVKPYWDLIKDKPAGFADGVDDGITKITMTTYTSPPLSIPLPGGPYARDYSCPSGKLMGGGHHNGYPADVFVQSSFPLNPTTWRVWARSTSGSSRDVYIWLNCMTTQPGSGIAARLSPSSRNAVSSVSKGGGSR